MELKVIYIYFVLQWPWELLGKIQTTKQRKILQEEMRGKERRKEFQDHFLDTISSENNIY